MPATAADSRSDRRREYSGYALLMLAILFWAGNSIVGRAAAGADIPPLALNFWRWVTALGVFALLSGRATWRQRRHIVAHWRFIVPFALVTVVGYNCAFYIALQTTTALQATLIQSILPVLVLLLGLCILRTPVTPRQWLGVVLSIGGAALIVVRGDAAAMATLRIQEGDAWALVAVGLWAIQSFAIRWKPRTIDILPLMTALSLVAVVAMAPLYALETAGGRTMPANWTAVSYVLYAAIGASLIGTTMWNEGSWRAGAAQAGYFGNLYPIFAGALAILVLGEALHWYHVAGALLVFAGICLAIFRPARG